LQIQQDKKIQQLYELTGMADILKGASQQQYTSAEETKTKVVIRICQNAEITE